ncbi:MAG: hypothetical protein ABW032_03210, partial [Burkholderiaceae bacterium]
MLPDGTYGYYSADQLYGWTAPAGESIEVRHDIAGSAEDGDYFVELDSSPSTPNSSMSTTIATTAGQTYSLSFWYSNRPASPDFNLTGAPGIAPAS